MTRPRVPAPPPFHPMSKIVGAWILAEEGAKVTPTPHVPHQHHAVASPYIQELSSDFAAVSMRVVLRGQSCFYHNDMCQELFLSSEDANQMYAANEQVGEGRHCLPPG